MGDDRAPGSRHRSGPPEPAPVDAVDPVGGLLPVAGRAASLLLPLGALVAVQATSPWAQRVPTGTARFDLAGAWLAAAPGALAGATSWTASPLLGHLQLGLLVRLLAAGPAASVLGAAQTALLLLAALQAALLWWLLRRVGRGAIASGMAVAAFAIAPAAVTAHATASTAAVAVVWLLVSGLLATARGRVLTVGAGVAAVLAIASQPLAAIPVAVAAAALVRTARRAPARPGPSAPRPALPGLLAAAVVAGALLLGALVCTALPQSAAARSLDAVASARGGPSLGAAAPAAWITGDPLGAVVAIVALVVVSRRVGTRLLGVVAALLLAASVWPAGADAAGPLVVLLPVVAAATARTLDAAAVALGHPVLRRSLLGSGWLTGVAALLLVAVVVSLSGLTALVPASARPIARAERWLRGSVPADRVVLVGLGAWPDLQGASTARIAWYATRATGSPAVSVPWSSSDYVVADAALTADADATARSALARSVPVAGFGTGADRLAIRAVRGVAAAPAPAASPSVQPTPASEAERRSAAARARTGRQLSGNSRIELDGPDRALLTAGRVDTRVALVLAQLSTAHRLTVGGFGTARGDTSGIRTSVLISRVDGRAVPADVQRTGELLRFLSALRGDFATRSIDSGEDGVTAGFTPDSTFVPSS